MEKIVLNTATGRIVGFELDDEDRAILKVRDQNGRTVSTEAVDLEGAPIPSGEVTITTTIEFTKQGRNSTSNLPNILFGKDGCILINSLTKKPFVGRTGPGGRKTDGGAGAVAALEKEEKKHGGRANSAQAIKWKTEFKAYSADESAFDDWNRTHHTAKHDG